MATVVLPTLLRPVVGEDRRPTVEADTVRGALEALFDRYPGLRVHLFDEQGQLRRHVLCFVDGEPTRLVGEDPALRPDSEVTILQSVAGGARSR